MNKILWQRCFGSLEWFISVLLSSETKVISESISVVHVCPGFGWDRDNFVLRLLMFSTIRQGKGGSIPFSSNPDPKH